jgi:hypothetical protein
LIDEPTRRHEVGRLRHPGNPQGEVERRILLDGAPFSLEEVRLRLHSAHVLSLLVAGLLPIGVRPVGGVELELGEDADGDEPLAVLMRAQDELRVRWEAKRPITAQPQIS